MTMIKSSPMSSLYFFTTKNPCRTPSDEKYVEEENNDIKEK